MPNLASPPRSPSDVFLLNQFFRSPHPTIRAFLASENGGVAGTELDDAVRYLEDVVRGCLTGEGGARPAPPAERPDDAVLLHRLLDVRRAHKPAELRDVLAAHGLLAADAHTSKVHHRLTALVARGLIAASNEGFALTEAGVQYAQRLAQT